MSASQVLVFSHSVAELLSSLEGPELEFDFSWTQSSGFQHALGLLRKFIEMPTLPRHAHWSCKTFPGEACSFLKIMKNPLLEGLSTNYVEKQLAMQCRRVL